MNLGQKGTLLSRHRQLTFLLECHRFNNLRWPGASNCGFSTRSRIVLCCRSWAPRCMLGALYWRSFGGKLWRFLSWLFFYPRKFSKPRLWSLLHFDSHSWKVVALKEGGKPLARGCWEGLIPRIDQICGRKLCMIYHLEFSAWVAYECPINSCIIYFLKPREVSP